MKGRKEMKLHGAIKFSYEVEKFVNAVAYFVKKTGKMDKLKAAKLLYFLDKYHLVHYGKPVTGDCYHRLDYGPVPSMSLDIMNDVICGPPLRRLLNNKRTFERLLEVDNKSIRYPTFILKREPDLEIFSDSEIEALDHTIEKYGNRTGPQLIDLTHNEPAYRKSAENSEIDYRLFVADSPNSQEILELMELAQENRALADSLNS